MKVHSATGSPSLLPTVSAVPTVEQSEGWVERSGLIRRRKKPPGSLLVHAPPFLPHWSGDDRAAWAILSGLVGIWVPHIEPRVLTSHASLDRSAQTAPKDPLRWCGIKSTVPGV
jgi:hypothetical protein